jgi:protein phosphatase
MVRLFERSGDEGGKNEGRLEMMAVLADGMGGHAGGARAAHIVTGCFMNSCARLAGSAESRMLHALDEANQALARAMKRDESLLGMGSTMLAIMLDRDGLHWVSVGDSALYLYRDGSLRRLNEDHSLAPVLDRMALDGEMAMGEASSHPKRAMLRSAVNGEDIALVDIRAEPMTLLPRDWLFLASDGLATLSNERIARIMERHCRREAESMAGSLIDEVKRAGKPNQDNVTLIAICRDEAGSGM